MNRLVLRFIASSACVAVISAGAMLPEITSVAFAATDDTTYVAGDTLSLNKLNNVLANRALKENAALNAQAAAHLQQSSGVSSILNDTGFRGVYGPDTTSVAPITTQVYSGERSQSILSNNAADRLNLLNRQRVSQSAQLPLFDVLKNSAIRFIHSTTGDSRVIIGDTELDSLASFNTFLAFKELRPYFARGDFYLTISGSGELSLSHTPHGESYTLPLPPSAESFILSLFGARPPAEDPIFHFASDHSIYLVQGSNEIIASPFPWTGLDRLINPLFVYNDRDYSYTIGFRQHGVQLSFDGGEHTTILGSPLQILFGADSFYFGLKDGRLFVKNGDASPVVYLDFARAGDMLTQLDAIVNSKFQTFSFQLALPSLEVVSVSHPKILTSTDFLASIGLNFARKSRINLAETLAATPFATSGRLPDVSTSRELNISITRNGIGIEDLTLGQGGFWTISNLSSVIQNLASTLKSFSRNTYFVVDLESGAVIDPTTDRQIAHLYEATLNEGYTSDKVIAPYLANFTYLRAEIPIITEFTATAVERTRDAALKNIKYNDLETDDWVRPFLGDLLRDHPDALRNQGAFDPARELTRAEAAKIILSVFDRDNVALVSGERYFMDTDMGSWQEASMVARYHGLLSGEKRPIDGFMRVFMRPDEPVSRCEFMKIATNAMCTEKPENCLSDVDSIEIDDMSNTNPFITYVRRGYDLDALNNDNRTFNCDEPISRRESVKILSILGR